MKRIALLGCGAIGTRIAHAIDDSQIKASLTHIYDEDVAASERLASSLRTRPEITSNAHMLSSVPVDMVVEAASQDAVRAHALSVIQNRRDLVVMSVGALLDETIFEVLRDACTEFGCTVHIPSGAIAGIDAIRAVSAEIESVTLTTTKHPDSLRGAACADIPNEGRSTVFEGNAGDAVKMFPKNVNVSALLSLAGLGFARTAVRIVSDSSVTTNTHTIEAHGKFGRIDVTVSNVPDPANAKTSRLAALSAIDLLRRLCSERGGISLGS